LGIYLILLFQQLVAGGTHIVAKALVHDVDPVRLTFLRSILAGILTIGILAVKDCRWRIERRDIGKLLWLSLLAVPINQFLFFHGIHHSTAPNAALLYATTPVVVLILSRFILGEKVTWRKVLGVTLALLGVTSVIFEHGFYLTSDYTYGNFILIAAVLAWALYTIYGKPMITKYGALYITSLTLGIGMLLYLPIGLGFSGDLSLDSLSPADWEGIAYLVIGTSFLGYYLWYFALARIEASKVATFSNIQPFLTTILAVIFLGQSISETFVIGGLITIGGVALVQMG
jgi:drug/metabolite transporter (DMT)-like permease